jgi:hypothetical protein
MNQIPGESVDRGTGSSRTITLLFPAPPFAGTSRLLAQRRHDLFGGAYEFNDLIRDFFRCAGGVPSALHFG